MYHVLLFQSRNTDFGGSSPWIGSQLEAVNVPVHPFTNSRRGLLSVVGLTQAVSLAVLHLNEVNSFPN